MANTLAAQTPNSTPDILAADYVEPTDRYPHGALGDDLEWGAVRLHLDLCPSCAGVTSETRLIRLPDTRVFEDTAPRLADLDGDGDNEVVTVESDAMQGARISIYDHDGLVAAGPFIGQRNRWLAIAGIGDLDGDGRIEIAYVDRPHLARILRVVEVRTGTDWQLVPEASAEGHTNHRFGAPVIEGGLRDCGDGPVLITASGDWSRLQETRLVDGALVTLDAGPYSPDAMGAATRCDTP